MKDEFTCTHKLGVKRIAAWLSGTKRMAVVMAERVCTATTETPDAVAWGSRGESILVEVKVSRSDFLADKSKSFRRYEEQGVGVHRYFAAPAGLLKPEDMPEGWGLLAIHQYQMRELLAPLAKPTNRVAEVCMLVSAIRRLELSSTVFVRHEDHFADVSEIAAAEIGRTQEAAHG